MAQIKSFLDLSEDCNSADFPVLKIWEDFAKKLPELNEKGDLQSAVSGLPEFDLADVKDDAGALQRTYTVFTFIAHSYIRGRFDEEILTKLPEKIAKIWIESGRLLGVPPISTYSSTVLFNFQVNSNIRNPEDFEILFTFTGTEDEKWFYAVSAAIDVLSREIIGIAEELRDCSVDFDKVGYNLAEIIKDLTKVLNRMYEKCRPEVFYHKIRRYFAGWFNDPHFSESGGLIYELNKEKGETVVLNLAGGSAAQNPTIQLLDILLDVKHADEPEYALLCNWDAPLRCCPVIRSSDCNASYLKAMREYMPREHREYLEAIEKQKIDARFKLSAGYQACIKELANFRSEHIKMVSRYIVCQNSRARGTGGSNPIPFLKKLRDDTLKQ